MKRNKKSSKFLPALIILIALITIGAFIANNWYNNAIYNPASNEDKDINLEVKEGDNFLSILPKLKEEGLIKDENAVKLYLRLQNISPVIKVGTYILPANANIPQLIDLLGKGVYKSSVLVTIPEALRYEEIANILETKFTGIENVKFKKDDFLDIATNPDKYTFPDNIKTFLDVNKPAGKPLQGFLFPDTYRFNVDADAQTIVETLISNLQKRLDENNISLKNFNSTIKNFYDVLTLASILEKEASKNDDPAVISGIFYNRLKQDYPLQADSTVNFITGKNDAGVLIVDSKIDSPYNTYKYPGLTPTPIDNPGIKTITAAINPQQTDYFFFVHDVQGNTFFAKTFEEHQANIANHL